MPTDPTPEHPGVTPCDVLPAAGPVGDDDEATALVARLRERGRWVVTERVPLFPQMDKEEWRADEDCAVAADTIERLLASTGSGPDDHAERWEWSNPDGAWIVAALAAHQWYAPESGCRCGWRWTTERAQDPQGWEKHQADAIVAAARASGTPAEPPADAPCAGCEAPSVVTVRVEWAETTDVARYCMDCAADLVGQGYGTVDEPPAGEVERIAALLTEQYLPWIEGDEGRADRFPNAIHARHRYDHGCAICRAGDQPEALRVLVAAVLAAAEPPATARYKVAVGDVTAWCPDEDAAVRVYNALNAARATCERCRVVPCYCDTVIEPTADPEVGERVRTAGGVTGYLHTTPTAFLRLDDGSIIGVNAIGLHAVRRPAEAPGVTQPEPEAHDGR